MALVSIIMPVYNSASTIGQSIDSLLKQTFDSWELFVIDDASTDKSLEIAKSYADRDTRISIIPLAVNSGSPAYPRNIGLEASTGDYIAFLDADDTWYPEKLEKQLEFMQASGSVFSCTGYDVIDRKGEVTGRFLPPDRAGYSNLLSHNTIGCLTAMYDAKVLGDRRFPNCGHEDYALWLEILRDGHVAEGLQESLAVYRLADGSVSSNKRRVAGYFWHIYRHREGFSLLKSLIYCGRYWWQSRNKYRMLKSAKPR